MQLYKHGGDIYTNPEVMLDFSVNTNPLGMPKTVKRALLTNIDQYAHYPDPECRELVATIALRENLPEEWILCGNGAADLIYRLCYAVKPHKALVLAPTFSEYEHALKQVDCQVIYHQLQEKDQFILTDKLEKKLVPGIDMLFLCHPNNPTGRLIPEHVMERILHKAGENQTIVVLDECFLDFTEGMSTKQYFNAVPGLVILKAFTKLYAMAGLRLGYMLTADKDLLNKTNEAGQCWSVSIPAQIAGVSALSCNNWEEKTRDLIIKERDSLSRHLEELGLTVYPSDANYLLFKSEISLYESLLQKGILIRSCQNFRGLDDSYYRVCVKTSSENDRLLEAIKEIIHG